jgi:hypothetical protein
MGIIYWVVPQEALSSVLILGIMREPVESQRVRTLLERFMTVMLDVSSNLGAYRLPAPLSEVDGLSKPNLRLHS